MEAQLLSGCKTLRREAHASVSHSHIPPYLLLYHIHYPKKILKTLQKPQHNHKLSPPLCNRLPHTYDIPHIIHHNTNTSKHICKAVHIYLLPGHQDTLSLVSCHGHDTILYQPYQTLHSLLLNVKSSSLSSQSPYTIILPAYIHMPPDIPKSS